MNLHNIERSAFRRGEYVGYAHGVWHIRRVGDQWRAVKRTGEPCAVITRPTLALLSVALENYLLAGVPA